VSCGSWGRSGARLSNNERIDRLKRLAWLLDSSIPIPGTRLSIGLEALIGLVPFLGDLVGVLVSATILGEAARLGVGRSTLARMTFNVAIEGLVGLIPLAGDVFDAVWKANQRNVRLLGAWLDRPARTERASKGLLAGIVLGLAAFAFVTISLTYLLLRWLVA
jgi:Domain of unknown function (DUF4112)